MYSVYVILCGDDTLYTGITTDIKRRFEEHREGVGAKYTRARKVKKLLYTEKALSRSAALIREAEIKKLSRIQKIELCTSKK